MNSCTFRILVINKKVVLSLSFCFIVIFLFCTILAKRAYSDWTPPKGIPDPSDYFSVFDPIDDLAPVVNQDGTCSYCPGWPSGVDAGRYYVDNNDQNATDTNNPYGCPDQPRETIPEGTLNAGDFVYIAGGGTYNASGVFDWDGIGTAANPIWITGDPSNPPVLNDVIKPGNGGPTSYLILQYFTMSGEYNTLEIQPGDDGDDLDHIVIRHFTMTGTQQASNYTALLVAWSQAFDPNPNSSVNYTVIYDGTISRYGNKSSTDEAGVMAGYHSDYTWILDCTIHDVGADAIAGCHYADDNTKKTEHCFIGRITTWGNGENGIDLKGARYVIISECTIYGPFTREQGWGIILHYGASPSTTVKDVWIIFNKIYHVSGGIYTSSVGADNMNIIGNLIYDVDADYAVESDPLNGYAVFIGGGDGTFRVVNNTFYDYDDGLLIEDLNGTDVLYIHGNIFANRGEPGGFEIDEDTDESRIKLDYNRYYYPGGSAAFNWGGSSRNLSYMQVTAGECTHGTEGDPKLTNPISDFSLQIDSDCIDKSIEHSVYGDFYTEYSIDIRKDFKGVARPQGNSWDIGAFEFSSAAPKNLRIVR